MQSNSGTSDSYKQPIGVAYPSDNWWDIVVKNFWRSNGPIKWTTVFNNSAEGNSNERSKESTSSSKDSRNTVTSTT